MPTNFMRVHFSTVLLIEQRAHIWPMCINTMFITLSAAYIQTLWGAHENNSIHHPISLNIAFIHV